MIVRLLCLFTRLALGGFAAGADIVLLAAFFGTSVAAQTTDPDLEAIEQHIIQILERDRVPGAAVAIVRRQEVLYLRGFGHDGRGRPVDDNTGFGIGSMSKAFTALVAMRLIEAGRVTLDTAVVPNVPELASTDDPAWQNITLRHLLTHTSGVPNRPPDTPPDASLSQHAAALAGVELTHLPGAYHEYSSGNYLLAARMLERVSGTPFDRLLAEHVLDPLGFASDYTDRPMGHQYWFAWPRPVDLPVEPGRLATASLTASAADMSRFLQFQLGDGTWRGQTLLGAAGLDQMHSGTARGEGFTYGLGWRIVDLAGSPTVQHGGVLPNFRGKMILLPDRDVGVVVLTNASSVLPLPVQPTSHELANDIAMHLAGGPLGLPNLGYRNWLILIWSGLGLVLLHQAVTLARVVINRDPAHNPRLSAYIDIAMVLAIVFALPQVIGLSRRTIVAQTPDLALWLAALSVMALCAAMLRLFRAARLRRP